MSFKPSEKQPAPSNKKRPYTKKQLKGLIKIDHINYVLVFCCIAIIPMIVRIKMAQFYAPGFNIEIYSTAFQGDAFSYWKYIFLIISASAATALLVIKILSYGYVIPKNYINPFILAFILFSLISFCFAEHKGISMYGLYNRKEGMLTYITYMALLFAFSNMLFDKKIIRLTKTALGLIIFVNTIFAISFFLGQDLGATSFFQNIVKPDSLPAESNISISMPTLLANINYSSGFTSAACCFFFALSITGYSIKETITSVIFCAIAFAGVLASLSSSGSLALMLTIPLILLVCLFKGLYKKALAFGTLNIAIFTGIYLYAVNFGTERMKKRIPKEMLGDIVAELPGFAGRLIELIMSGKIMFFLIPAAVGLIILIALRRWLRSQKTALIVLGAGFLIIFPVFSNHAVTDATSSSSGIYRHSESGITKEDLRIPRRGSAEDGITGRLYIWEKTAELILKKPLVGYGLDTLVYYFPHFEKQTLAGGFGRKSIVAKPHNFYLGIAFGLGLPCLAALVLLFAAHAYITLKNLTQKIPASLFSFQLGLLSFFCAYLVQWLVNDSMVGVSIVFWSLLGISACINTEIKNLQSD